MFPHLAPSFCFVLAFAYRSAAGQLHDFRQRATGFETKVLDNPVTLRFMLKC
jgi:hypothetical protein